MTSAALSTPLAPPPARYRATRDLLVVATVTLITFSVSAALELREWLTDVTRSMEVYQIDELPFTFAALALALAWFSWRRWRQASQELTLRVAAQQALVEREAQYRTLFMENIAGNTVAAPDGTIQLCNPAMARILGLASAGGAAGRNLGEFYADRTLWQTHVDALMTGEKVEAPLLELKSVAGNTVRVIARMLPHRAIDGATELEVYFTDISELHLIQKELAQTLAENRLLSQRYVAVQEAERRNLARELHDELGQCLNAIKLDAVSIREVTRGTAPDLEQSAISIIDISSHVYDVVRSMMQRLRPATLDALGLRDAVAELINQWRRRNAGVECAFETSGDLANLGEVTNITVYRLVQECLTNIGKHASATLVRIALHRHRTDEVSLTVSDNGRGMDLHAKRAGLGLLGLRERVEALHGNLELISAPGAGMQIMAHIGIPSPQAE